MLILVILCHSKNLFIFCVPQTIFFIGVPQVENHSAIYCIAHKQYHMFFEVRFFGSFGQLAVQAAQIWAVFGRRPW